MSDRADACAHYRDARYYDHAYQRYKSDVAFYRALADEHGGPILELGVGTGRIARALLKDGHRVVGVDAMESMITRARERAQKLKRSDRERLELHIGDIRELDLGARFPLVTAPFNVFQHLYDREDIERALSTVRRHLEAGGVLAFDVLVPDPGSLARDPAKWFSSGLVTHPRDGRKYRYAEAFDYDHKNQVQTTTIRFRDVEDEEHERYDKLPQRQFFPAELEALLHYNGFDVERHLGDFGAEPIDVWTESQCVVARRR